MKKELLMKKLSNGETEKFYKTLLKASVQKTFSKNTLFLKTLLLTILFFYPFFTNY